MPDDTYDDGEQFPAHNTCAYNGFCEAMPDPGSIDGLCTYHRADAEPYDTDNYGEWL